MPVLKVGMHMKFYRKDSEDTGNVVRYYGEGSPYTPYTGAYNPGAVQINLSDIFPGTGLDFVFTPSNWSEAWNAFKGDLTKLYKATSKKVQNTFKTARNWFKSFFS